MQEDPAVFEMIFWQVCQEDFPGHTEALRPLLAAGLKLIEGDLHRGQRGYDAKCRDFFRATQAAWPRYEAHRAEWARLAPAPDVDDEELDDIDGSPLPNYAEMGELLAHRIVMAYYREQRIRRYSGNVVDRPVWRLVAIEDGRTHPDCIAASRQVHHWQSEFWLARRGICPRLFCRCRIQALTIREAAEFLTAPASP